MEHFGCPNVKDIINGENNRDGISAGITCSKQIGSVISKVRACPQFCFCCLKLYKPGKVDGNVLEQVLFVILHQDQKLMHCGIQIGEIMGKC